MYCTQRMPPLRAGARARARAIAHFFDYIMIISSCKKGLLSARGCRRRPAGAGTWYLLYAKLLSPRMIMIMIYSTELRGLSYTY